MSITYVPDFSQMKGLVLLYDWNQVLYLFNIMCTWHCSSVRNINYLWYFTSIKYYTVRILRLYIFILYYFVLNLHNTGEINGESVYLLLIEQVVSISFKIIENIVSLADISLLWLLYINKTAI